MKFSGSTTSPIKSLITQKMKGKGLSRSDLVNAIGYTNISKGCQRLDAYLETLEYPSEEFINKLLSTLEIDPFTFFRSLEVTIDKFRDEAARSFSPYIQIFLSIKPTPHFAAGLVYRKCRIHIPSSLLELPLNEEIEAIHDLYQDHIKTVLNDTLKNSITGFRYHRSSDYYLMFDPNFKLVETLFVQPMPSGNQVLGNRLMDLL